MTSIVLSPLTRAPWFLLLALLLAPVFATAAEVDLTVTVQDDMAEIGKNLVLNVELVAPSGQALRAEGLEVEVRAAGGTDFLDRPYPLLRLTEPVAGSDPASFSGTVRLEWSAPVKPEAAAGTVPVEVIVSGRLDSGTFTAQENLDLKVDYGDEWNEDRIQAFIANKGYLPFMLVVFGFGILMSLSPCIYPMIPITLAVIGAQSQEKGPLHGLMLSVTYAIGLALVYAIIGAVTATIFAGLTAVLQSPPVLIPIALLLVVLSFGMFGAFELQAPEFLREKLSGPGGNRSGLIGVFVMGMIAGLVASPCVGPFLNGLLLWVATTGNWVLGFFTLFTFGIGLSLLLIAVGTFPSLMGSLPQSGGWMETIKKAMGLLLIAMALYFVRPGMVIPENIFYPLVGAITVLVAAFMGAFDNLPGDALWWDRARKGLGLIVMACGLFILIGSFYIYGVFLPVRWGGSDDGHQAVSAVTAPVSVAAENAAADVPPVLPEKVQWQKIHTGQNVKAYFAEQFAQAEADGKPVMIDFWAEWCKLCKALDKKVWNQPEIVAEAQRFVTIKVDATETDEEMVAIWQEFSIVGLPAIVFIDSRGDVLHGRTSNFKPADQMLELMQNIR